ncbi:hypothetical protein FOA52_002365 [Chlamydomonas sp. UWO 241]|nr:hypothetical protein FOA52_002365 [Chlamydomonas sp. UWO 241]
MRPEVLVGHGLSLPGAARSHRRHARCVLAPHSLVNGSSSSTSPRSKPFSPSLNGRSTVATKR